MTNEEIKIAASQLRKPHGEHAIFFGNKMNEGNKELYRNTLSVMNPEDEDVILEIGMGNGNFVKDILSTASNIMYHGCDYSKEMVAESKKNNKNYMNSGTANFLLSNASNLPFSDDYFDTVFSVNTIYFWEDKIKILNELSRVLTQNGKLVLALRPEKTMNYYPFVKHGFELFSKNKVVDLLERNHFTTENVTEKKETDQIIDGFKYKVESLIVIAKKSL